MDEPEDPIKRVSLAFDAGVLELAGYGGLSELVIRIEKFQELRSLKGEVFHVVKLTVRDDIKNLYDHMDKYGVKELQIVNANHPEYIVFYRIRSNQLMIDVLKELDFDVYFTNPEYYDGKHYVVSFYSHQSTILKIFQLLRDLGIKFQVRALTSPVFTSEYLLRKFSPKQLEMLLMAGKQGYYEFPRKVSAKKIADMAGTSVQMLHEHLRKAENKLVKEILEDYMPEG